MTTDYTAADLANLERHDRIRLVNSALGVRPAHLLGTRSAEGVDNLAMFNSAQHVGAHPAFISVLFRPLEADCGVRRDSWDNIQSTGEFTLSAITPALLEAAHRCAEKSAADASEFVLNELTPEPIGDSRAPVVSGAPVQMALRVEETHTIACNNTVLLVGRVEHLRVNPAALTHDHVIAPWQADALGVLGLDWYASSKPAKRFAHRR